VILFADRGEFDRQQISQAISVADTLGDFFRRSLARVLVFSFPVSIEQHLKNLLGATKTYRKFMTGIVI